MTNALVPLYREMAADGAQFHGLSVLKYADSIRKLARSVGAKSMLDYGCGRGDAYKSPHKLHQQIGIRRPHVRLYDPAFPGHDDASVLGTYDLVVSSDVLEHVPESELPAFLAAVFSHADKAVWLSVCCRPAKKCFPGTETNLHITIRPYEWWYDLVSGFTRPSLKFALVETP